MNKPLSSLETLPTESSSAEPRFRLLRPLLLGVVPALVLGTGLFIYLAGGRYVETDNAYVQADQLPLSSEVSGTVQQVLVVENQTVAAGEVILRLDPRPFQIAEARAEARLQQVASDIAALQASYNEKLAEIALNRTRSHYSRKDEQRQATLRDKQYISAAQFDAARQASDLDSQQIAVLEQDLRRIAASLGGAVDTPLEQQPSYRAAQAELDEARLNLARTEVKASLNGTVSNLPKPGQYLSAGKSALMLVASDNLWVEANFPETDLTYVRSGQPVSIHIDTYPEHTWQGTVQSLSPATGAQFSVLPAQNATGNWVKIVQRVPVRIHIQPSEGQPHLLAGLSSVVEIDTAHQRSLFGLQL